MTNELERRRGYAEAFRLLERAKQLLKDARKEHLSASEVANKKAA